jgi:hypothetical protein
MQLLPKLAAPAYMYNRVSINFEHLILHLKHFMFIAGFQSCTFLSMQEYFPLLED